MSFGQGRWPTPALVISCVALFAALGGTAVALDGHNSVTSKDIKNGEVTSADIANNDVRSIDLKDGGVTSQDIRDSGVSAADLRRGSVGAAALQPNSVSGAAVDESSLDGSKITGVDAVRLGGSDAGSFLKGTQLSNFLDVQPNEQSPSTILDVPGLGRVISDPADPDSHGCNSDATKADVSYVNTTDHMVNATVAVSDSRYMSVDVQPGAKPAALQFSNDETGYEYQIQLATGNGTSARIGTIEMSVLDGGAPTLPGIPDVCRYVAHGFVTP